MDWGWQWAVAHLGSLPMGLTVIRSMEREGGGGERTKAGLCLPLQIV